MGAEAPEGHQFHRVESVGQREAGGLGFCKFYSIEGRLLVIHMTSSSNGSNISSCSISPAIPEHRNPGLGWREGWDKRARSQ